MKRLHLGWAAVCLSFLLAGCGTQVPLSGKAFDDYMESIKPALHYWVKEGMTVEGRRADSVGCGAGNTDYVGFNNPTRLKAAQLPGETENQTETRLKQDWRNCMTQKSYRYERDVTPRGK